MFESIQSRFQTVILVLLVFMLSGVFVLQFGGPQAQGCSQQLSGPQYAARVQGVTITKGDFDAAYRLLGFDDFPAERAESLHLRELAMDGLVERELLVHAAEEAGVSVEEDDVLDSVVDDATALVNPPVAAPYGYPGPEVQLTMLSDRNGQFSTKNLRRFINHSLRRSTEEFEQWQYREHVAHRMREVIAAQVSVAPGEVREQYARDTERAEVKYIAFRQSFYRDRVDANADAIRTWMTEHATEVDEEYRRQRHRYTGLEEQVRASHILVKVGENAPEAERATARTRAEALLARARAGEDFATLARENSDDEGSARRDGDLGWNPRGRMVAPFDTAQFALQPGQITESLVESQFGFHIIKLIGRREGDVPEEEAKLELAEGLYRAARAGELAREDATRALAYLREGHTMDELDARLAWNWQDPPAAPVADPADPNAVAPAAPTPPARGVTAPQVRTTRSFGRTDTPVPDAAGLTRAAFALTMDEPLPSEPLVVGTDVYVFQLTARTEATDEGFTDEVRDRLHDSLLSAKQLEAVRVYVTELRRRARAAGQLRIEESLLRYRTEQEESPTPEAQPAEPTEEHES